MNAIEAIITRCSVRRFTDAPVNPDLVEKLLQAAMAAPSAHNEQPWHFIVVDDRQVLTKITAVHPYAQMLNQAPLALCVCGDLNLEKEPGSNFWIQDCAAATENILLAANALGLGSCWVGVYPRQQRVDVIRQLFNAPENIVPFSLIALGYAADPKPGSGHYKANRIHKNQW